MSNDIVFLAAAVSWSFWYFVMFLFMLFAFCGVLAGIVLAEEQIFGPRP